MQLLLCPQVAGCELAGVSSSSYKGTNCITLTTFWSPNHLPKPSLHIPAHWGRGSTSRHEFNTAHPDPASPLPGLCPICLWAQVWVFISFCMLLSTDQQACPWSPLFCLLHLGALWVVWCLSSQSWGSAEFSSRDIATSHLGIGHANLL